MSIIYQFVRDRISYMNGRLSITSLIILLHLQLTMGQVIVQPGPSIGKDAYVSSKSPNTNFGTSSELYFGGIGWQSDTLRLYIQFDLSSIPRGTRINTARLYLYTSGQNGSMTYDYGVYQVIERWEEAAITWNNQPRFASSPVVTFNGGEWEEGWNQWHSIRNLELLIQDWVDNPSTNFGLMIKAIKDFYGTPYILSSDYTADSTLRPRLVINSTKTAISGTIRNGQTGSPVGNAVIKAYQDIFLFGSKIFALDTTDASGSYELVVPYPGTYKIKVDGMNGYLPSKVDSVDVLEGRTSFRDVTIDPNSNAVGGIASGTWSRARSPYIVSADITVKDALTIDPGVQILFAGRYKFIVQGLLTAVGTQTDSIIFSRYYSTEELKGWGIRFISASNQSQMKFCRVEYGKADDGKWGSSTVDRGGGIYIENSSVTIENNTIQFNQAGEGAGVYVYGGNPIIRSNTIKYNSALLSGYIYSGGGGLYLESTGAIVENNLIVKNSYTSQTSNSEGGGGIYINSSSQAVIRNNLIIGNVSKDINYGYLSDGAAIYCSFTSPRLENNTIYGNIGATVIRVSGTGSQPTVANSIVWGNTGETVSVRDGSINIGYTDIQGGYPGIGNISLDPLFIDASAFKFELQAGSPCVDAGDPSPAYNDQCIPPAKGLTRNDMGAYGGPASCNPIPRGFIISAVPKLISPSNGAIQQPNILTLRWNRSADALSYRIQVARSVTFTVGLVLDDSTVVDTIKTVGGLANDTKYYWRVSAKSDDGSSDFSSVWNFTTGIPSGPPSIPLLVSPLNEATGQPTILILRWYNSAGAMSYRVQVATDSNFVSALALNDSTVTDTSKTVTGISTGTVYYWRVSAKNSVGASAYSMIRKFTTAPALGEYLADANTVLLMHMNETSGNTVKDVSSYGNHGTATGTTIVDGRFGKTRSFNGLSDRIDIASTSQLNVSPYLSLEAWIKPSSFSGNNIVIRKNGPTSQNGYFLGFAESGTIVHMAINTKVGLGSSTSVSPSYFLDGRWHHIAGTYDGTTARVYIDGVLVDSDLFNETIGTNSTDPVCIGANDIYGEYFSGSIDEVRISNKVRQPGEFNLQLPPKNLTATAAGTTINLTWQNGGGAVPLMRYKIYRGPDSTNASLIDSTTSLLFSNTGLTPGTRYFFRVTAVDSTGFEGARSYAASATTTATSQAPTITSFSPTSGPIGTSVTITGTNFSTTPANNVVYFGAVRATVTAATSTSLSVTVPAGATYQPITVTVNGLTAYSRVPFIVTFSGGGSVSSGSFASKIDFTTGTNPLSVAFGDVDGDGKPDLVICNSTANTFSVYRNTATTGTIGVGSFAAGVSFATALSPVRVVLADFNGDGKLDALIANQGAASVSILQNSSSIGNVSFMSKIDFSVVSQPWGLAVGDIDNDGRPDFAATNYTSGSISVFRNIESGQNISNSSFAAKVDLTAGSQPFGLALGDIDSDGKVDLVVANNASQTVSILRNISTSGDLNSGSFQAKVDFSMGTALRHVALGDLDGDGKLDLVLGNDGGNVVSIMRNTTSVGSITTGSFSAKVDFTVGSWPENLAITDIDGDGKSDIITGNNGSGTMSVLQNRSSVGTIDGTSLFPKVDFTIGLLPVNLTVGAVDIDGDGKPDLLAINEYKNSISVFRNVIRLSTLLGEYRSDENTVLLLHMNELSGSTVSDASGQNNHATTAVSATSAGRFGNARVFDGSNNFIFSPVTSVPSSTPYTIEGWIKVNPNWKTFNRWARLFSNGQGWASVLRYNFFGIYLGSGDAVALSDTFNTDRWYHYATVFESNRARMYINAELKLDQQFTPSGTRQQFEIGGQIGTNDYLSGIIDEVRISNIARLPSEFNLQLPPKNITATASGTTINLSWQNGGGAVGLLRYKVYRGLDSTNVSVLDSTAATAYSNMGLVSGTRYYYRVSAVDSTGFEGAKSYAANAVIPSSSVLPGEYTPDANTVLLLHMNETSGSSVSDASSYGNNGTVGSGVATSSGGRFGSAKSFDGTTNASISIPASPSITFGTGDFSAEVWMKTSSTTIAQRLLLRSTGTNKFWGLALGFAGPAGRPRAMFQGAAGLEVDIFSTIQVNDGNWHHIAVTRSSGLARLYVDGVQRSFVDLSSMGTTDTLAGNLFIGGGSGNNFAGIIDEVRVSNIAQSPTQFNLQLPPKNLTTSATGTTIALDWQNGGGGVGLLKYRIYRGADSTSVALVDSTISTSYLNKNLATNTQYFFRVAAVDSTGFESVKTDAASASTTAPFTEISSSLTGVYYSNVAWCDYNNDGKLDIMLTGADDGGFDHFKVYRNDGQGFTEVATGLPPGRRRPIALGDFDNDGNIDVLTCGSGGTAIYRNTGGNFTAISASLPAIWDGAVAWGDYDNDGDSDLLVAGSTVNTGGNPVTKLFRNMLSEGQPGDFVEVAAFTGVYYGSVAWGDFDNDGRQDICVSGLASTNDPITKLYHNENGTFVEVVTDIEGAREGTVAWGDYDSDGDPDILLVGESKSGRIAKVYRNDGSSTGSRWKFIDIGAPLVGIIGVAAWGDCDNDGDLDILMTGSTGADPITKIYYYDQGRFNESGISLTGAAAGSAAWGDYDNDGDLDIVVAGQSRSLVPFTTVYRNNSASVNTLPSAPSGLSTSSAGSSIVLSWAKSTDGQTLQDGLTYNLRIGTTPNGNQVVSSMANALGFRRIARMGNMGHRTSWPIDNLPSGTYYWSVQAIDNSFVGSAFAPEQTFSVGGGGQQPSVTTNPASAVSVTSATLNGAVNPNGLSTSAYFEWGTSSTLSTYSTTSAQSVGSGTSAASVSADLSDLSANTTYYYRVMGQSSAGTERGTIVSFSTLTAGVAPTVTTGSPSNVSTTSATLTGTVNPNGLSTSVVFQYGTSTSYGNQATAAQSPVTGTSAVSVSASLTGLSSGATYHYRVVATSSAGTTNGTNQTFTTLVAAPTLVSPANGATNQPTTLTLTWSASTGATSYRLQVATSSTFTTAVFDDSTITGTSKSVGPLAYNTTYYWRAAARGAGGSSSFSQAYSFSTLSQKTVTSPGISFPSNPTSSNDYRLVSFPGSQTLQVSLVLAGSQNQDWKIFTDNGGSPPNHLSELNSGSALEVGKGYWLIQKGTFAFSRSVTMPALGQDGTSSISLRSGWNIIGLPFDEAVSINAVIAADGLPSNTKFSTYGGSQGFQSVSQIEPFKGYYFNNTQGRAALKIPYPFASMKITAPPAPSIEWKLQIVVESETNQDAENFVGIAPSSSNALDALDEQKPPFFADQTVLYLSRPEWDKRYKWFSTDFRPAVGEGQVWDFEVSNPRLSQGTIRVVGVENVPAEYEVILLNASNTVPVSLRESAEYRYQTVSEKMSFRLVVGKKGFVNDEVKKTVPNEFALEQNYPNPFNPSTSISFKLPREAQIRLEVISLLGQSITLLAEGRYPPGTHTVVWNSSDHNNGRSSSGVYLYRLVVNGSVLQTKKMILLH